MTAEEWFWYLWLGPSKSFFEQIEGDLGWGLSSQKIISPKQFHLKGVLNMTGKHVGTEMIWGDKEY